MALDEEGAACGVEARSQKTDGGLERATTQLFWVNIQGEGVEVNDAVEGVVFILVGNPRPQRTKVVAEVQIT
jgi:hypothetical protein